DRDLSGFADKAEALKRAQSLIQGEMRDLPPAETAGASKPPEATGNSRADRLRQRKDALASDVAGLESSLDKVSREARREQKETSRKLQEAANGIRDSKLKEKIRYTMGLVGNPGAAEPFEKDITGALDALGQKIRDASKSMGSAPERKKADALDRARDLARGLDSIKERLRARGIGLSSEGTSGNPQGQPPGGAEGRTAQAPGGQESPRSRGAGGGGRPGGLGGGSARLGSEEARQLRGELNQRAQDAEALRRALDESGISSPQAAALAQRLQGLASDRNLKDPLGLAELTGQVADDLKMMEYVLRREVDGNRPALQLSGSEELPPGYRAMVEEYYKTLARKPKK
ncbi:MAG: hypothetical protein ABI565_08745, partial [Vicinamibacteria bacterium]